MRKLSMLVMGCGIISMLVASPVMASTVIYDSFNQGTPGTSINGQTTEWGGATWVLGGGTTANYTYETPTNNDITSYGSSDRASQGTVALGDMLNYGSTLVLKADLLIATGDDYVGLGFFNTTSPDWNNINQPQFRLHPDGSWTFQNLSGGTIAGFTANVYHNFKFEYEVNNDNLAIYMDGNLVATQWVWQTAWRTITPTAAGFRINDTGGSSKVDNFVVYVPEPMTLGLLGMGLVGLIRRKK